MTRPLPKTLLPFSWHFIRKHKLAFAVFFAAPLLLILEAVALPYALKMVIDAFTLYDQSRETIMKHIAPALWLAGVSWFSIFLLIRLQEWWQVYLLPKVEADIRMSVAGYTLKHSYHYFANRLSGNLANKIGDLPRALDALFMYLRWNVVATLGTVVATLLVVASIQPLFALIFGIWVVCDLCQALLFVRYINRAAEVNAEDKSQLSGRIVDSITNMVAVKLFAKRSHELSYIREGQYREQQSNTRLKWRIMVYRFCIDIPVTLMWVVLGYLLITYWQEGRISTGDVVFVFNSIWSVMMRMWFLGEALAEIFKNIGVGQQALSTLMEPHEIADSPEAKPLVATKGQIVFDDVTFHYQRNHHLFENKHVEIAAGSKIGLVGFSGSGKTTFVNLILRFFEVEKGRILIDGQDITKVTQGSLRAQIAMIPQDTILFHRSLMENIRYGRQEASDEEVLEASRQAHCDAFIRQLPEGYHTLVGERGIKLSGGQRQRIAIARAILKNAPILILDEATSALDSMTERHIQQGLHLLMENRTTIVIAHRLSTLSEMDRILVFDKGHIIEDGTHEALLQKNGHYTRMWHMQAGGFLPEQEGQR